MRQIIRDILLSNSFIADNSLFLGITIFLLLLATMLGVVVFTIMKN